MPKKIKMHNKLILVICLGLIVSLVNPVIYNAATSVNANKNGILKTTTLKIDKKIVTPSEDYIDIKEEEPVALNRGAATLEEQIVSFAHSQLGKKYVWGATGESVFDGIGLVKFVYGKFGIKIGDSIENIHNNNEKIEWDNMSIGDLVFFQKGEKVDHIGIFIGDGDFIHVTTSGVIISSLLEGYYSDIYAGAIRIH